MQQSMIFNLLRISAEAKNQMFYYAAVEKSIWRYQNC